MLDVHKITKINFNYKQGEITKILCNNNNNKWQIMIKLYLIVLEKSEGKLTRDKSHYQRLPFLSQKKTRKWKKEGELTALGSLIGATSDSRKHRKTRYSFHSNLIALLDQICTQMHWGGFIHSLVPQKIHSINFVPWNI